MLEDVRLTHDVIRGVVQILGQPARSVNGQPARVGLVDDVLLNQLHLCHPHVGAHQQFIPDRVLCIVVA
jgi:hypothetical protein